MVLLHIKRDDQEFILQTTLTAGVEDVTRQAVELFNLQHRVQRLHKAGLELAAATPGATQQPGHESSQSNQPGHSVDSEGPAHSTLLAALDAAAQAVSNDHAARRAPLTLQVAQHAVDAVRAAVTACSPHGIPEQLQHLLDTTEPASAASPGEIDAGAAELYFAGKRLETGKVLRDHLTGANERSKVVLGLQPQGAGRPPRQPQLDADGERAMLAWWHRKQEDQRRAALAAENDAASDRADWADPRALQRAFQGIGDLKVR